jgi:hypothetical protein
VQRRFTSLVDKLERSEDAEDRYVIRKQLSQLTRILNSFSIDAQQKRNSVPMPKSYIEERRAKIEAAARVSGRKRMRARIVQGGAPGNGSGGKRK